MPLQMQLPVSVIESDDPVLSLFPHRFDFLYAPIPAPGDHPLWQTESRYPLSDRMVLQNDILYGVRFGKTTNYVLIDIDKESPYHPAQDPFAVSHIIDALEPLGLVRGLMCQSSYSKGLHLYFPWLGTALKSWEVGRAVTALLGAAGFKVASGILEVFPNPRTYHAGSKPSLYSGHRLPLQDGFYLLNESFQALLTNKDLFANAWRTAATQNDIDEPQLKTVLRQYQHKRYCITEKAEKFLNDLNTEIEKGWTDYHQTNDLLGRITMRSYIFGHVLYAEESLTGEALIKDIIQIATELPGYQDYCRHQEEIEQRAKDWVRCIEASAYYPYGTRAKSPISPSTWHQDQSLRAKERIRKAIAHLLEEERFPATAGQRFKVITQEFKISGSTLYKYRDLWHPEYIQPIDSPPDPPAEKSVPVGQGRFEPASPTRYTNLLGQESCNTLPQAELKGEDLDSERCNIADLVSPDLEQLKLQIQEAIAISRAANVSKTQQGLQHRHQQAQVAYVDRLRSWLVSGDPILEKEALQVLRSMDLAP